MLIEIDLQNYLNKKFMRKNIISIAIIAIIFVFSSCEKNELSFKPEVVPKAEVDFEVRDGYLVFKSKEAFRRSINTIINLTESNREKWEKGIGFMSQQRITNNVIREELKKDSINRIKFANTDLSPNKNFDYNSEAFAKALSLVSKSDLHSEAYYNALNKGIIKLVNKGTLDEYWDYNILNRSYIGYINEDGLFGIADTLYQVTDNGINSIKYIDNSSKTNLLKSKLNTTVNKIRFSPTQSSDSPGVLTSGWVQEPSGPWYPKRIKLDVELSMKNLITLTLSYEFYHRFYVTCQQRNVFRQWIRDVTYIKLYGTWEITVYRFPQVYSSSFSYSGNAANIYGSKNPENGQGNLYDSYYSVSPNQQNYDYGNGWPERQLAYQPEFNSLNWSVTRTDKNLTASIVR